MILLLALLIDGLTTVPHLEKLGQRLHMNYSTLCEREARMQGRYAAHGKEGGEQEIDPNISEEELFAFPRQEVFGHMQGG